ncbi:hypothetical protein M0804_002679 [Polistes exclamans]|nr:hypothetical protein M0804_002679 [Polistes exclamans]
MRTSMATEGVVPCRTSSTTSRQIDLESLQNPTKPMYCYSDLRWGGGDGGDGGGGGGGGGGSGGGGGGGDGDGNFLGAR